MINWLATSETEHSYICVNCRLGSACAVRVGWSETTIWDYVRFCAKVDRLNTEKIQNKRTASFRICLCRLRRLRRLIRDDSLRNCPDVPFRVLQAISSCQPSPHNSELSTLLPYGSEGSCTNWFTGTYSLFPYCWRQLRSRSDCIERAIWSLTYIVQFLIGRNTD